MARGKKKKDIKARTESYDHKDAESSPRLDVNLQAQFKKRL